ncbi:DNA-protecting protein DprA [Anaerolineales bacterium HSG24]|nr:DNA-protecting protein DprA [Anaerolineales bacterium HSG24]
MKATINNQAYWLALTHLPELGGATLRRLLERFGRIENLFQATAIELAALPHLAPNIAQQLPKLSLNHASAELEQLQQQGIGLLTWDDVDYPARLFDLASPPPVLFWRGQPSWSAGRMPASSSTTKEVLPSCTSVAIVGSRQVSQRSRATARRLASDLSERSVTIVSGLALGIDQAAHQGTLDSPHGQTVAVLGNGLATIYPSQNRSLAKQIIEQRRGVILSEQRPELPAEPSHLMRRNRIIAALSQAVIVVEASRNSGALEAARQAQKLGRRLYAYPGSLGTDWMLAQTESTPLAWDTPQADMVVAQIQQPISQPVPIQPSLFDFVSDAGRG